jgi:hypothetical protein
MTHEATFDRLLVLLDPSSPEGDSGAKLARLLVGPEGHIHLVVALSGPEAGSLRDFADAESMTVKDVAGIYLRQTILRIGSGGVTSTLVDGTDLAADLVDAIDSSASDGIVIPAAMVDRTRADRATWDAISFPVLVVPPYRVAA